MYLFQDMNGMWNCKNFGSRMGQWGTAHCIGAGQIFTLWLPKTFWCSLGDQMLTKMVASCSYRIFQPFGVCQHHRCSSRHNSLRANFRPSFFRRKNLLNNTFLIGKFGVEGGGGLALNCYHTGAVAPCTIPVTKASDVVIGEVWSDIKRILLIFFGFIQLSGQYIWSSKHFFID